MKKGGSKNKSTNRFIHSVSFKKTFGIEMIHQHKASQKPVEKIAFVTEKERIGWPKSAALAEWNRLIRTAEIADYQGLRGAPRYWFAQDVERATIKNKFITAELSQSSDTIKNASDKHIDALRNFVHDSAADHSHEFFKAQRPRATATNTSTRLRTKT